MPVTQRDGVATALVATGNIAVEILAPAGEGEGARRLAAALADGEGLKSLVFATHDIECAHRRAERVGLSPESIATRAGWRSFRLATKRTGGARLFLLQRDARIPAHANGVTGLDHVVVRTPDPDRAAATYGARLGLDLRLDREVMGRRLMFFRCGDAIVEILCDRSLSDGHDRLWGLSWRVDDAHAARARLAAAGLAVSEVRAGLKPGTSVFSVLGGTCGVPTLMIAAGPESPPGG